MKPIDLVFVFLLVAAVVVAMLWRRRARKQIQQHGDWIPPKPPTAKIISLHAAAKPRRRPF